MRLGIIGCGHMGSAFAQRLALHNHEIFLYDRHREKIEALASQSCGIACESVQELLTRADLLLLAIKPHNLKEMTAVLRPFKEKILFSLLAGTTLLTLREELPEMRLFRLMPNIAIRCGCGIIGIVAEEPLLPAEKGQIEELLAPLGSCFWLPETKIDALTALAASGPGLLCAILESMIDAGIAMGMNAAESQQLTYKTVAGTISLLESEGLHPGILKWQVASPQGTTITGLRELERAAVRGGIMNAFLAAWGRSRELS